MDADFLTILLLACTIFLAAGLPQAEGRTRSSSQGRNGPWELHTQDTLLRIELVEDAPTITALQKAGAETPHNWAMPVPEVVLPFEVEEDQARVVRWRYVDAAEDEGRVSFTYHSESHDLELTSTWESTPFPGPIEHSVFLTNKTGRAITIGPIATIYLPVRVEPMDVLEHWWVEKGAGRPSHLGTHIDPLVEGYTKALLSGPESHDDETRDAIPWFCAHSSDKKHGIYGGIEFSGWTRILLERKDAEKLDLSLGLRPRDERTRIRVEAGRVLELPTCFIGAYTGEVDDGCNRLHRWVERHILPAMPGGATPVLVNNSWGSDMAVDEDLARRMIDDSVELGIELYHVDAGWYREVGDWHSNRRKFPAGLDKIADYAHSKGLKFGLWVGWTQGGSIKDYGPGMLSVFNPAQTSWFPRDYPDDWRNHDFSGATVCLGSEEAKAWCLDELRRIIKDYKLDLLEHDQVMVVDYCAREGHGHIPGDPTDVSRSATNGYYEIHDTLLKENPNLLLENCVNGGRFVDFGVARRSHYVCANDSYDPLSLRRAFYDTSYPLPPCTIEGYVADHPGETLASFKLMLRSGMLGWCTIMIDTRRWSQEEHEIAKREFVLYKQDLRPLIASGNVYHVLPRPDGMCWDGMQYFDPETGKGVLFVFRPQAENASQSVILKGLDAGRKYTIRAEDGSVPLGSASGEELMIQGLVVRLPKKDSSDLIFLTETR